MDQIQDQISVKIGDHKNRKISIFLVLDDAFIAGAINVLYSIAKNETNSVLNYVGLYDNSISSLSSENMRRISAICPEISFCPVANKSYRQFPVVNKSANLSLLKFEIFNFPATDYGIYIDTDTLIVAESALSDLINYLENSDQWIIGVENKSRSEDFRIYEFGSFAINAGIFAIKSRPFLRDVYAKVLDYLDEIIRIGEEKQMICQPALNHVLMQSRASYISAPFYYNFKPSELFEQCKENIKIIHYVTRLSNNKKPWQFESIDDIPKDIFSFVYIWHLYYQKAITKINNILYAH